jgi:nucleolar protein 58
VSDEKKLSKTDPEDIHEKFFSNVNKAKSFLQLVQFQPFEDTAQAVAAASAVMEGKVTPSLKSFLKKPLKQDSTLCLADKALAVSVKESLSNAHVLSDSKTQELFRGIRLYMEDLFGDGSEVSGSDIKAMQLGLSHSLGRYKLKFSADKVDTMVIQAVGLLDELDKEINTYAMRVKEWYGWHFPELQGLIGENAHYAKLVLECGLRSNYRTVDLSSILEDEHQEKAVKEAAEVSMGTEVADMDILHMQSLANQVLSLTEYRAQLWEYLKNRMNAIAPNLTILVGELVGARLISHAGSLLNLAKQPASTVQILGAEKALFRALKTKHDTPKYGLIYHASLVGQAAPKHKGKVSRVLAAKSALAIRVDALSDDTTADTTIGYEGRAKVEARLRQLEGGAVVANGGLGAQKTAKYDPIAAKTAAAAPSYNEASDMVLESPKDKAGEEKEKKKKDKSAKKEKKKKRKAEEIQGDKEKDNGDDDDDDDDDEAARKAAKKAAKKAKKEKKKSKDEK